MNGAYMTLKSVAFALRKLIIGMKLNILIKYHAWWDCKGVYFFEFVGHHRVCQINNSTMVNKVSKLVLSVNLVYAHKCKGFNLVQKTAIAVVTHYQDFRPCRVVVVYICVETIVAVQWNSNDSCIMMQVFFFIATASSYDFMWIFEYGQIF